MTTTAAIPETALLVPLFEGVVLPGALVSVSIQILRVARAVYGHPADEPVALVPVRDPGRETLARINLHDVGCLGRVVRVLRFSDDTLRVLVEGEVRVRIGRVNSTRPSPLLALSSHDADIPPDGHQRALAQATRDAYRAYFALHGNLPLELEQHLPDLDRPSRLADYVMANLDVPRDALLKHLALDDVSDRLRGTLDAVTHRREVAQLEVDIQAKVQASMDRQQREYFLKEQLRVIQAELGDGPAEEREIDELRTGISAAGMPAEIEREAELELERMSRMHPEAAELTVSRTYLDWLLALPWHKATKDRLDLKRVERILHEDHAGLEEVKERMAEYLAVRQLKPDMKGPILCLMGPPGVGKTSLGRSIARALGRQFVRISLGGIKDEGEIRGHRRTYIAALPGRILQSMRRAGTRNPVMMLDEIDKVGQEVRGDPASALLEALDPEQNHAFTDHYMAVPYDLSQVMFLLTANVAETIPAALHDRMEIIELPGYTEEEKQVIARDHLVPRQIKAHGLTRARISFDDDVLREIIRSYTAEAGVRGLEREIARCCRKVARRIVRKDARRVQIDVACLVDLIGPRRYRTDIAERMDLPGIAVGLAWTPAGGEILFIEASRMEGGKTFKITGQLGQVMRESAEAALSYIRANAERYGIDPGFWERSDLHVHIPAGAIPKDGPSAGVPLTVALVSLLTGRTVHGDLGMTGEITLRGKILPVGGVKEKCLAARRAGLSRVVLPADNEKDLLDIPEPLRETLEYTLVERIDQVIDLALTDGPPAPAPEMPGGATP